MCECVHNRLDYTEGGFGSWPKQWGHLSCALSLSLTHTCDTSQPSAAPPLVDETKNKKIKSNCDTSMWTGGGSAQLECSFNKTGAWLPMTTTDDGDKAKTGSSHMEASPSPSSPLELHTDNRHLRLLVLLAINTLKKKKRKKSILFCFFFY